MTANKNVIISDVVKVREAWRGQAWRDTQRLLITAGASVDGPPKRCSAAALLRCRAAALPAAGGSGSRPVAAVARKTSGGRARQAKEEQDKSGQVRTGHLT